MIFFFFFLSMSKSAEIRGSAEKSHAWGMARARAIDATWVNSAK